MCDIETDSSLGERERMPIIRFTDEQLNQRALEWMVVRGARREEAIAVRDLLHLPGTAIKASVAFVSPSLLSDQRSDFYRYVVGSESFASICPSDIEGICVFMLTVGVPEKRDGNSDGMFVSGRDDRSGAAGSAVSPTMELLLHDMWGTAYLDAARTLLEARILDHYRNMLSLTGPFIPGMQGIDVKANVILGEIVDARGIDVEITDVGLMAPAKTVSGIYFVGSGASNHTTDVLSLPDSCRGCPSKGSGCSLCVAFAS
jgi:hypothetical protein